MVDFKVVAKEIDRDAVDALLWAWSGEFFQTPVLYADADGQTFAVAHRSVEDGADPKEVLLAVAGPYDMPVDPNTIATAQSLIGSGDVTVCSSADLESLGLTTSPVLEDVPPVPVDDPVDDSAN